MTTINIRIDPKLKREATKTSSSLGLDLSSSIKIFLSQFVLDKGFPFVPNLDSKKIKAKWDKETAWALKHGKRYKSFKELVADL